MKGQEKGRGLREVKPVEVLEYGQPTAAQRLKAARHALGLTDRQMAAALQLRGANAKDDLRKMEDGMREVTGPVLVAAEALALLRALHSAPVSMDSMEDEVLDFLTGAGVSA